MNTDIIVALISFLAGIVVALVGGLVKLLEYRLERKKLEIKERQDIAIVLGSSQSNFVRAARDLYRRISSFFDRPDSARQWLKPGSTPERDEYYLREFVRLLFNFIVWGRITQDTIDSLPTTITKERPDLQQTFVFVDLALDLLAYSGLFQKIDDYDAENQDLYLFMGHIDAITEAGIRLWKEGEQNISRAAFDDLYHSPASPLTALRNFLVLLHTNQTAFASFIVARLAALRAALAGFLIDYSWTIYIPDERILVKEFEEHLQYASKTSKVDFPFVDNVPQNLDKLMNLYQCKLFHLTKHILSN
jgi:hypothetical protein